MKTNKIKDQINYDKDQKYLEWYLKSKKSTKLVPPKTKKPSR